MKEFVGNEYGHQVFLEGEMNLKVLIVKKSKQFTFGKLCPQSSIVTHSFKD